MKRYRRSNKCELASVSVAWNVLDDEQRRDFEYIVAAQNHAGRIRDCVRAMRMGLLSAVPTAIPAAIAHSPNLFSTLEMNESQIDDGEALKLLTI